MKSELLYAGDGTLTAVRHRWTFDEMFSTFATQGLDTNNDGKLSREELQGLAEVNVTSLKEFGYFTQAKADGKPVVLTDPKEYWLEHQNGALTLNFTLPLGAAVRAKAVELDIYDATYFVDFSFAKEDAAKLVGAPAPCRLAVAGPNSPAVAQAQPPNEAFFNQLGSASNWGARYANKISVTCP